MTHFSFTSSFLLILPCSDTHSTTADDTFVFEAVSPTAAQIEAELSEYLPVDAVATPGSSISRRQYLALVDEAQRSFVESNEQLGVDATPAPTRAPSPNAPAVKQPLAKSQARPKYDASSLQTADITSPFANDQYLVDGRPANINEGNKKFEKMMDSMPPHVTCDVFSDSAIYLNGSNHYLVPDNHPASLRAIYNFDDLIKTSAIDSSGNGLHATTHDELTSLPAPIKVGPGRLGRGNSASLQGQSYLKTKAFITAPDAPRQPGFTLSAWLYLSNDRIAARSVTKGCFVAGTGSFSFSLLPSRKFIVHSARHSFTSHALLRPQAWTHVALVYENGRREVALYVNGIRDVVAQNVPAPQSPIPTSLEQRQAELAAREAGSFVYLGGLPATHARYAACRVDFLLDDVRISQGVVDSKDLAAESFPSLGPVEASFVTLGCSRFSTCNKQQAIQSCGSGHHLCTRRELDAGALQVARTMGWVDWSDPVWAASDKDTRAVPETTGSVTQIPSSKAQPTTFLEIEEQITQQTFDPSSTSSPGHYQVGEAIDLSHVDATPEQLRQQALEEAARSLPQQHDRSELYALLDAEDLGADSPAPAPTKPTPMPAPAAAGPAVTGLDSRKTITSESINSTAAAVAQAKAKAVRRARKAARVADSGDWVSKVALCCAYN